MKIREEQTTLPCRNARRIKDTSMWKREKHNGYFDVETGEEQKTLGCESQSRTKDISM
jgi:hypothetical protein